MYIFTVIIAECAGIKLSLDHSLPGQSFFDSGENFHKFSINHCSINSTSSIPSHPCEFHIDLHIHHVHVLNELPKFPHSCCCVSGPPSLLWTDNLIEIPH
uniref:Uncharacterized protein n=1 Tax=Opuntia streptacantha TaxID=393608 RepID=A0A7C9DJ01_OPUST